VGFGDACGGLFCRLSMNESTNCVGGIWGGACGGLFCRLSMNESTNCVGGIFGELGVVGFFSAPPYFECLVEREATFIQRLPDDHAINAGFTHASESLDVLERRHTA